MPASVLGLADLAVPTECALALTPSEADDGRWTSLEVLAADISSDLVVFSACNSGVGAALRGEATMRIARAFLAAGAPRVVCSLWKVVDDATATLMREFHRQRNGGKGSAAALKAAQRLVASGRRTSAPRYWAAWILLRLGDG